MKGLSIALRILAILGAATAVAVWVMTQGKVEEAQQETAQVEARANAAATQVSELESQLINVRGEFNQASQDLADAQLRVSQYMNDVSVSKREISKLKSDKDELNEKYAELEKNYTQLRKEMVDRESERPSQSVADNAQLREMEDQMAQLKRDLQDAQNKLSAAVLRANAANPGAASTASASLAPTTNPDGTPAPQTGPTVYQLNAQSASILRSDYDKGILIISRGQVDGLQKQMEFNVTKGLERSVRVKLGTVAPTYSVAYILPGQDPGHLQEGDQVSINNN